MVIPRWMFPAVLAFAGAAAIVWFFTSAPWLQVKHIYVEGEATQDVTAEIEKLRGQNILWLSVTHPDQAIRKKQPSIKQIQILRGIPDTLRVKLIERDPAAVWQTGDKRYTMDANGFAFRVEELQRAENGDLIVKETDLPVIVDNKNLPVALGQNVASGQYIAFIREVKNRLPQEYNLRFVRVEIDETMYNVRIVTDAGWSIHMDTTRQLDPQMRTLSRMLETKRDLIKEYVDVRVRGWVYIK